MKQPKVHIHTQPGESLGQSVERTLAELGYKPDLNIPLQTLIQEIARKAAQPW